MRYTFVNSPTSTITLAILVLFDGWLHPHRNPTWCLIRRGPSHIDLSTATGETFHALTSSLRWRPARWVPHGQQRRTRRSRRRSRFTTRTRPIAGTRSPAPSEGRRPKRWSAITNCSWRTYGASRQAKCLITGPPTTEVYVSLYMTPLPSTVPLSFLCFPYSLRFWNQTLGLFEKQKSYMNFDLFSRLFFAEIPLSWKDPIPTLNH